MWSTITRVLFFSPHFFVYSLLNHLSYPGTKWLHWMILRVFCCARAARGASTLPARPVVSAAPVVWMNFRREILLFAMCGLLGESSLVVNCPRTGQLREG